MFGIVIVSHSRKLAESLAEFAGEVSSKKIPLAFAGGVNGEYELSGTDATDILAAVESVYTEEGVIVFTDIGSSVLSSELALDFLDADKADNVYIARAPLVEGVLSAAVQCSAGVGIKQALKEAEESIYLKAGLLKDSGSRSRSGSGTPAESSKNEYYEKKYIIKNPHGLHARPASKFVQAVSESGCRVGVSNITAGKGPADGLSLNRLSALEILKGHEILVHAEGSPDAAASLMRQLENLVESNFGDYEKPETENGKENGEEVFSFSEGAGIGEIFFLSEISLEIPEEYTDDPEIEKEKLLGAVKKAKNNLQNKIKTMNGAAGQTADSRSDVFKAHIILLDDPDLKDNSIKLIKEKKYTAAYAWSRSAGEVLSRYSRIKDQYIRTRAADVRDAASQVLSELGKNNTADYAFIRGKDYIAAAEDITPADILKLCQAGVKGIILRKGSSNSHAAIIARTLGIPGIGGYRDTGLIQTGDKAAVDGFTARVYINPSADIIRMLKEKTENRKKEKDKLLSDAQKPAQSADGTLIPVYANISSKEEAAAALLNGADGIGVIRTEYLFINSMEMPSEEKQYDFFISIFSQMKDKPVTVRTFDIGGDKQIPFMNLKKEDNPYLGMRGIRLYFLYPLVFKTHIRALLRAARGYAINIMFPMVSTIEEIILAKKMMEEVHLDLKKSRIQHKWPVSAGIMIETPSSVLQADEFAEEADFFSIGTNDLVQYVMAAERGNSSMADYLDPFDPAVVKALKITCDAGRKHNIPVSLCGEMGGDPEALELILKSGISSISANPLKIPAIKKNIRQTDLSAQG